MFFETAQFRRRLLHWYRKHRRDLPWRVAMNRQKLRDAAPDPYHVLVSEAMLQQTQVATVIPYFKRFIAQLPTLAALAAANEEEVLRLWQGLGYYSRARNLRRAAIAVVKDYGGKLPKTPAELLKLPGVGRYTAGAIASIAFGKRAPILDGNVARVLCRIDKIIADPRERATAEVLWTRAADVMPRAGSMGDFNSALMELGATVCTPRNPKCLICPVREHCEACAAGVQEKIPVRKKSKPTPLIKRWIFCIQRGDRWLIEQRPAKGRWAGMWQFITRESDQAALLPVRTTRPEKLGLICHALTHRRYEFQVLRCEAIDPDTGGTWVTLGELERYPLPRPHVKVAQLLQHQPSPEGRGLNPNPRPSGRG
jgi:A/G-specific adenine glycosylase